MQLIRPSAVALCGFDKKWHSHEIWLYSCITIVVRPEQCFSPCMFRCWSRYQTSAASDNELIICIMDISKTGLGATRNRTEKYCPRVISPFSDCKNASSHRRVSVLASCDFVNESNECELILCHMIRPERWSLHGWGLTHLNWQQPNLNWN